MAGQSGFRYLQQYQQRFSVYRSYFSHADSGRTGLRPEWLPVSLCGVGQLRTRQRHLHYSYADDQSGCHSRYAAGQRQLLPGERGQLQRGRHRVRYKLSMGTENRVRRIQPDRKWRDLWRCTNGDACTDRHQHGDEYRRISLCTNRRLLPGQHRLCLAYGQFPTHTRDHQSLGGLCSFDCRHHGSLHYSRQQYL